MARGIPCFFGEADSPTIPNYIVTEIKGNCNIFFKIYEKYRKNKDKVFFGRKMLKIKQNLAYLLHFFSYFYFIVKQKAAEIKKPKKRKAKWRFRRA